MEDVEEQSSTSHQSSFDKKKAFDSTCVPLVEWSLRRLGVPDAHARDMATADVDGTTIVRTPYAESLWHQLPYSCVDTEGDYPPGILPSDHESKLVQSFSPERGSGQGDPPSPLKWNAIFDIVATGLRLLDSNDGVSTWVRSEDNLVYRLKDIPVP